jgi:hypothetical protein
MIKNIVFELLVQFTDIWICYEMIKLFVLFNPQIPWPYINAYLGGEGISWNGLSDSSCVRWTAADWLSARRLQVASTRVSCGGGV